MNFILEIADRWSNKILETLYRFPLATLSAFIVTILSVIIVGSNSFINSSTMLIVHKVAFVASMGIFLFPALHLLSKKIWFKLVGLGLLALYYYLLPLNILESTILVRHALLILALNFMLFWAPFMDVHISNKNIWDWTQNILLILLSTIILSITLYAIFFGTMYSIEKLFGFSVERDLYFQFLVVVIGIFSVNYFLSHLPKYIMLLQVNRYAEIGLVFTKYILTPIFLIYFLLIFAYIIKITIEKRWLQVEIDSLSLGYSIVAISTYMYWTLLWEDEANRKFRRFIWGSTLALSIVLSYSIWVRVEGSMFQEYYLLTLFTAWLASISLYFLFFKEASYKWLFFSISLLIVISQSEPLINLSVNLFDKVSKMV